MTPKQRVLTALEHREPDRVPFDFGATAITSIHYRALNDLARHLDQQQWQRGKHDVPFMDVVQSVVQVDREIAEYFGVDVRGLIPGSYNVAWSEVVREEGEREVIRDRFGAGWVRPVGGFYFDQEPGSFPLMRLENSADVEAYDWPKLYPDSLLADLETQVGNLGSDYAIAMSDPFSGAFFTGFKLRGSDRRRGRCPLRDRWI